MTVSTRVEHKRWRWRVLGNGKLIIFLYPGWWWGTGTCPSEEREV